VISVHLSFAKKIEIQTPLCYSEINENFLQWISKTAIRDVQDWLSEKDMCDE